MSKKKGLLVVVSGPSGVGKDTLVDEYLKVNPGYLSVSATSRKMRKGEKEGVNYFYLTEKQFEEKIDNDEFVEYAKYNGNYYGTLKSQIEDRRNNGEDVFLVIEVQGGIQIKKKIPDSVLVFLLPPSLEELEDRLSGRGSEEDKVIKERLKIAEVEIEVSSKYDYTIVNGNLNNTMEKLKYILEAEKEKR